jgi:hypothetical protein
VAQLVEALNYKLEGRGFDSRWRHWNFSLTQSTLRNIPEERRSHLHRGGSLKSRKAHLGHK